MQDADDWSDPRRLERQLAALNASPDIAVVGCRMAEVDERGNVLVPEPALRVETLAVGLCTSTPSQLRSGVQARRRARSRRLRSTLSVGYGI